MFNIYTEYLIREALEDGEGININGQNITNIRYADDTIILAESEQQHQHMIDKLLPSSYELWVISTSLHIEEFSVIGVRKFVVEIVVTVP